MKRVLVVVEVLLIAVLLSIISASHSQAAPNSTPVCGTLTTDTTWTAANSPYDVCATGVTVNSGVTLTIDAGVTAQFEQGPGNKLTVLGNLNAVGTAAQPIILTAVVNTPGSWRGISADGSVATPAVINLDYVTIGYGGDNGSYGAQVYADHAQVTINHGSMSNGAGRGVYATTNTVFNIQNTSFASNGLDAITLNTPSADLLFSGLTASANGADGVRLLGTTIWPGMRHWSNPGIPYIVDGEMSNTNGDMLSIDPGTVMQFTAVGFFNIGGELKAQGTPTAPIVMTGATQSNGAWRGIYADGGSHLAVIQLDYATVEYGGSDTNGANIELQNSRVIAHYSIIRNSAKDGIRLDSNAGGSIVNSQVYGNGNYGVNNITPTAAFLASNDWWGDAGGPRSDIPTCSSGLGDKVTAGVLFVPFLTDANTTVTLPLTSAPTLSMTPRTWYAPADGTTKIYFDLRLTDGNGTPLSGRTIRLHSTLGTVTDGGVTDPSGKTLAYLTSSGTGDAQVYAAVDPLTACEASLSPDAKVTFTTPAPFVDLMPDDSSPYSNGDIWVAPLPVIAGVPTTIYARMTNPLSTPVTTNVEFAYAQSSIGLAFGPIKDFTGVVLQPMSSIVLSAQVVPPISGHYCVQVSYTITQMAGQNTSPQAQQLKQFNWNAQQGTPLPSNSKDSLDKANKAFNAVKKIPSGPTQIQKGIISGWWDWVKDTASKISQSLGFDPARQDYTIPTIPAWHKFTPVAPDPNISAQRAAALNAVSDALFNIQAYGTAASTALDRYAGASAAGNLTWASAQSNEMLYYLQQLGNSFLSYANNLDAFVAVLKSEGETNTVVTVSDVVAYQTRLATSGFTTQEIADAHQAGLTDSDIEAFKQEIIASNPADIAGDLLTIYTNEAATARDTGNAILNPAVFDPSIHVGGGQLNSVKLNSMAQVYDQATSFLLSNPYPSTSQFTLSVRRLDLPADWTVDVSPAQVSLAPGQQITVTVNIIAGSPVPQGSHPRVAIEGYVNGQLLSGVVIDLLIPQYQPFNGRANSYLSLLKK